MPSARGKKKGPGDWQYVVKMLSDEHIPLDTTRDGVRGILLKAGIGPERLDGLMLAIDQGGIWISPRPPYKSVHRRMPRIDERLSEIAGRVRGDRYYGRCWWQPTSGVVWWSHSFGEVTPLTDNPGVVDEDAIRRMFLIYPEVKGVRVVEEAVPDPTRGVYWKEVFPVRF